MGILERNGRFASARRRGSGSGPATESPPTTPAPGSDAGGWGAERAPPPVPVADDDPQSIAAVVPAGVDDDAVIRGIDGVPLVAGDVDRRMVGGRAVVVSCKVVQGGWPAEDPVADRPVVGGGAGPRAQPPRPGGGRPGGTRA